MPRSPLRSAVALTLFCAVSAVLVAAAPDSAGWPQWRGPGRDGVSKDTGLLNQWPAAGPALAWKSTGLGGGFSSLAISGGKIFTLGDRDGAQHAIALNQADGKVLWTGKVGPVWEDQYGGPRSTPSVDGDSVYVLGSDGDLVAFETATGRERWRKSLPGDFGGKVMSSWKWAESPLVDGDRVIVTPGGPTALMVALDKKTGKEVWRTLTPTLGAKGRDGAGYSSVVISNGAGVKQYVQLTGRGLVGVRASDGKFLWSYNQVANDVANISTPIVKGDHIFASTGYQTGSVLLKLAPAADKGVEAKEVYFLPSKTLQNHHGGLVLVGDHLYGGHGHNKGFPVCVEMATGKVVWGGEGSDILAPGTGSAAVTAADGHLYFRYQNGKVALIEATPQGYKLKGSFDVPEVNRPSWSHPVIVGGKLYLREQENLYVYNVKKG